ncbi:AI-2E family transporter [Candidatus Parcubacteria bacterium]|nr:AI-2E family transporter [Candidatus Parcubacteria bacterium]
MNKQNIYFIALVAIFGLLSLFIFSKFIVVLVLAYIFSTLLSPVYVKINNAVGKTFIKNASSGLSAFITMILFVLIIITPVTILLSRVVIDTQSVYETVATRGIDLNFINEKVATVSHRFSPSLNFNLNKIAETVSGFFVSNIGNIFSGTVDIALKSFLFLLAMFYFLKDGKQFGEFYTFISPLKKESDKKIFDSIKQSVNSIMLGSLTVAIAQGVITGLGLWVFGVPNPFFFGTLAGFLALIPGIGAPFVWIPAAIYLYFAQEGSFVWLYLSIWGIFAVGLIDNFLGPKVMNKGIKIHQLFILLSIIGGISVFGPEGVILGPLVLSLFVAIIKIWNEKEVL